ncbi:metallophosphoesterase family protein [Jeotgalibaca sp. A127]|uniref:metallophosphoesterase family protein n=1 Tax=Jeotgalibaca sp. A127 TaxID=3457324 RepID=UPI003FD4CC80
MELRLREDGTFRIVQFTDTHIGNRPYNAEDLETFSLVKDALAYFDADLIMHTGDVIWSEGVKDADLIFEELMGYFNTSDIPMALTFGNHDSEEIITRSDLRRLFEKNVSNRADKKDVFVHDDRESYTLQILAHDSDEVVQVVYVLDSGADAPVPIGIYDWNQPEQVEWFRKTSAKYRKGNGVKRNLVFQHIPVPEYWQAATNILAGFNNETNEAISAPHLNTGLFTNMLLDGETWGMFVGHDHENNFDGLHYGIHLVYGNVSGFNTYGEMERGVRVIELDAKTNTITTEVVKYHAFKK